MSFEKATDGKATFRLFDSDGHSQDDVVDLEEDVMTAIGPCHVVVHGDRRHPAIVTYHDIGLTSRTCFEAFFNHPDMTNLMKYFCVYHVNALGQQEGALTLPLGLGKDVIPLAKDYIYPTMEQLSLALLPVLEHFGVKTFIGFGVGAGANILARFALYRPERVDGLVILNANASKSGWIEWAYQKWNAWYLKSNMLTPGIQDYLLWHWFGNKTMETNADLVTAFVQYMKCVNPVNLGHFISSYIKRDDLGIWREMDLTKKPYAKNFHCPVMLVAGDNSAHLDDTVEMNGRLDPTNSNWVKFRCGGMILEECPDSMCESLRLFLQGLGYVPYLRGHDHSIPDHGPAKGKGASHEPC